MIFRFSALAFMTLLTAASFSGAEARTHFSFNLCAPFVAPVPCVPYQPVYAPTYVEQVYVQPAPVAHYVPAPVVQPAPVMVVSPYAVPVMRPMYRYAPTVVKKTTTTRHGNHGYKTKTVKRSYYR